MARDTNGSSQYLWGASAVLTGVPLSLSIWVKPDRNTHYEDVFCLADASDKSLFMIQLRGAAAGDYVAAVTGEGGSYGLAYTSAGFQVGVWQHILAVFGATNSRTIYIGGGNSGSDNTNLTPAGLDRTSVGAIIFDSKVDYHFDGLFAELAVWNTALTAADAGDLARKVHPSRIRGANLVAHWPLGGAFGRHDKDLVGGYDLAAANVPGWGDHPPLWYPDSSIVVPGSIAAAAPTWRPFSPAFKHAGESAA